MEAIKKLLELARAEQTDLWNKLTYRSAAFAPSVADCMRWTDRIRQLNIIIEFLKRHIDEKKSE